MVRGRKRQMGPGLLQLVGSRHAARNDPVVKPGEITLPDGLSAAGRAAWGDAVAAVRQAGLLSPSFAMGVALLAEALGDFRECVIESEGTPRTRQTERGESISPIWKLRSQSWERLNRACKEFGLSPASIGGCKLAIADGAKQAGVSTRKTSITDFRIG